MDHSMRIHAGQSTAQMPHTQRVKASSSGDTSYQQRQQGAAGRALAPGSGKQPSLEHITLRAFLQMAGFDTDGWEEAVCRVEEAEAAAAAAVAVEVPSATTVKQAGTTDLNPVSAAAAGAPVGVRPSSPGELLSCVVLSGTAGCSAAPPAAGAPHAAAATPAEEHSQPAAAAAAVAAAEPSAVQEAAAARGSMSTTQHQLAAVPSSSKPQAAIVLYPFGPPPGPAQHNPQPDPGYQQPQQQQQLLQQLNWELQQLSSSLGLQPSGTAGQHSHLSLMPTASPQGASIPQPPPLQPVVKRKRGRPRKDCPIAAAAAAAEAAASSWQVAAADAADPLLQSVLQAGDVDAAALPPDLLEEQQWILDTIRARSSRSSSGGGERRSVNRKPPVSGSAAAAAQPLLAAAAAAAGDAAMAGAQPAAAATAAPAAMAAAAGGGNPDLSEQYARNKRARRSYGRHLLQQAPEQQQQQLAAAAAKPKPKPTSSLPPLPPRPPAPAVKAEQLMTPAQLATAPAAGTGAVWSDPQGMASAGGWLDPSVVQPLAAAASAKPSSAQRKLVLDTSRPRFAVLDLRS